MKSSWFKQNLRSSTAVSSRTNDIELDSSWTIDDDQASMVLCTKCDWPNWSVGQALWERAEQIDLAARFLIAFTFISSECIMFLIYPYNQFEITFTAIS